MQVEEIDLFRERRTHLSKGCGFVTMVTRGGAVAAMQALDEKHVMEGGTAPIAVKWADPDLQYKKRKAVQDGSADNRMVSLLRACGFTWGALVASWVQGLFAKGWNSIELLADACVLGSCRHVLLGLCHELQRCGLAF